MKPILLPGGHYKLEIKKRKSPKGPANDMKIEDPLTNVPLTATSTVNARTKSNFNGNKQVRRLKKVD